MGDYAPPFTITNKILTYVSSISEKDRTHYSYQQP